MTAFVYYFWTDLENSGIFRISLFVLTLIKATKLCYLRKYLIDLITITLFLVIDDLRGEVVVTPSKKLEDLIHLAELCVDLLQQNEEHYAEVRLLFFSYKYINLNINAIYFTDNIFNKTICI